MLVLSRKLGEEILIGDGVTVKVTRIQGNRVTLGIEAPKDVDIMRGELTPYAHAFRSPISGKRAAEARAPMPADELTDSTTIAVDSVS